MARHRRGLLILLVLLVPVLVTLAYVRAFAVELPWMDDWDILITPVHHLDTGHFAWSELNAQHTESLVLFPLSASLLLARLTGCQILAGIYLSYAFLCGGLVLLFLFFRDLRLPGRWSVLWFLPVSLEFLGWRQSEGLLWNTHLLNTMSLFFVLAALYSCTRAYRVPRLHGVALLGVAIACAWIASFSMASGALAWPLGAVYLVVARPRGVPAARMLGKLAGWLAAGGLCAACVLLDRVPHHVPWPSGVGFVLRNLFEAWRYSLVYLGGPLSRNWEQSLVLGSIFVALAGPTLVLAWIKGRRAPGVIAALLLVAYVGLGLGPLLIGRLGLGVEQAFSSRYVTLSSLALIGVYFCLLSLLHRVPACRYLAAAMLILMAVGILNSYSAGLEDGRRERTQQTECAQAVKDYARRDPKELLCAHSESKVVVERSAWMQAEGLSLFRQGSHR